MEDPKTHVFSDCQKYNRTFQTYQEEIAHSVKGISIFANIVQNMPTKKATPTETIRSVSTQEAKSKTKITDLIKDRTNYGGKRMYGSSQWASGHMEQNSPSNVPNWIGAFGQKLIPEGVEMFN